MKFSVSNLNLFISSIFFSFSINISLIKTNLVSQPTFTLIHENKSNNNSVILYSFIQSIKLYSLLKFTSLIDLCLVDNLFRSTRSEKKLKRFQLIYNFVSLHNTINLHFITNYNFKLTILSFNDIFKSSVWSEREAFDMFGILFKNHKDLRRLLTDYGFVGFPLQKSFPVYGFKEVRYSEEIFSVMYSSLSLTQAPRSFFNLSSKW